MSLPQEMVAGSERRGWGCGGEVQIHHGMRSVVQLRGRAREGREETSERAGGRCEGGGDEAAAAAAAAREELLGRENDDGGGWHGRAPSKATMTLHSEFS